MGVMGRSHLPNHVKVAHRLAETSAGQLKRCDVRNLGPLGWPTLFLGSIGVWLALVAAIHGYLLQDRLAHDAAEALATQRMVADIVPPPLLLIELRLVLSQAVEGSIDAAEARRQFDRLADDYRRHADEATRDPSHQMDPPWLDRPHEAGLKFIEAARTGVIQPLLAGNDAQARSQLGAVHALYLEHRAAVDQATGTAQRIARHATAQFESAATQSFVVAGVSSCAAIVLACIVGRLALDGTRAGRGLRPAAPDLAADGAPSAIPGQVQDLSRHGRGVGALQIDLTALQAQLSNRGTDQPGMDARERSTVLADLLLVIEDVAFQTQVLSMNTSVAVARAGEPLGGMAAVAADVRALAAQSADAARLVKALAATRVLDEAHAGTLAASAGAVAVNVLAAIARVRDRVQQASDAATAGFADATTQHQAALLLEVRQETAQAADRLRQRADWLAQAVAVFRLSRG
jgi:methyl-accepting chemotaxis protein